MEKVVSSPKFEKPSSKLCKIFYKTLTELHSDSTLGLIEKFSKKNGYEYSREFVNCVSRNVWPGKKTTEALLFQAVTDIQTIWKTFLFRMIM